MSISSQSNANNQPGSNSLAGRSALVDVNGNFKKPSDIIDDADNDEADHVEIQINLSSSFEEGNPVHSN